MRLRLNAAKSTCLGSSHPREWVDDVRPLCPNDGSPVCPSGNLAIVRRMSGRRQARHKSCNSRSETIGSCPAVSARQRPLDSCICDPDSQDLGGTQAGDFLRVVH